MSKYAIYLSWNNQQEAFQLPVNPAAIEIGNDSNGKTYNITELGEINVIKDPKLSTYSFSSFFPASSKNYPFMATNLVLSPQQHIDYILKWMASKQPVRFIFTGDSFDINTLVSIEQFDWKEEAGTSGDVEYTLKLQKYVSYGPKQVKVVTSESKTTIQAETVTRADEKQPEATYTLVAGDCLWKVAKLKLGDGARWPEIQKLNNISDAQLKSLPIGMIIKLPVG